MMQRMTALVLKPATSSISTSSESKGASLLARAALTLTKSSLVGIHKMLLDVIKDEEWRNEFPKLVVQFLPKSLLEGLGADGTNLSTFLLKNYLPDILEAAIKDLINLLEDEKHVRNFETYLAKAVDPMSADHLHGLVELICYIIQHNIPEPIKAAVEVIGYKLKDKKLNDELMVLIGKMLTEKFFSNPHDIDPLTKKLVVALLSSIKDFLTLLNTITLTIDSLPGEYSTKEAKIAVYMYQHVSSNGLLNSKSALGIDQIDLNIRLQLEELLWIVLFPEEDQKTKDIPLTHKMTSISLAAYAQKMISTLFTPLSLQILFDRLLTDPINMENPFEKKLPPSNKYAIDDPLFSKNLDELIKGICAQVIRLGIENSIARSMGEKLLTFAPSLGDIIQKQMKRIFQSGVTLLPFLLSMQFLYKLKQVNIGNPISTNKHVVQAKQQALFLETLKAGKRQPMLNHFLKSTSEDMAKLQNKVDRQILDSHNKRLEDLIEKLMPFGTRNLTLELLRKLYRLSREDLILKVLLAFCIDGLKKALKPDKTTKI